MLSFISFILVCIGAINWFSIGILQYDFVAGIFGSQSNIFSRLIYAIIGVASIIVSANLIKNKGRFTISFKKATNEYENYMQDQREERKSLATESSKDNHMKYQEKSESDISKKNK